MATLPATIVALSMGTRALNLSKSSFGGSQFRLKRSFSRMVSPIVMMPEGPEVRTVVDQLQGGVGKRLVDIQFLSGRYIRHGRPVGFEEFAMTMTPSTSWTGEAEAIDQIQEWNAKGKFIYLTLDDGNTAPEDDDDFARSIWITLGMSGRFLAEGAHQQDPRFARWYLEMLDIDSGSTRKIYYHDQRNFGVLRFCLSQQELTKKLESLGPDMLSEDTTIDDFLERMDQARQDLNVCKFLMDQSKIAGVGNYILAEGLYRAMVDPFASLNEINESLRRSLFDELRAVSRDSYQSQGMTRPGGTFQGVEGDQGQYAFQLQCYGQKVCPKGNPVIKDTSGPHKRTIWYTEEQLFKPLSERRFSMTWTEEDEAKVAASATDDDDLDDETTAVWKAGKDIGLGLTDPGWKEVLGEALSSESFSRLQAFLDQEIAQGETIYPPPDQVFSAFNLCPFEKTKIVIVGQDPYHGPGQGHGLAFSVQKDVKIPPSLRNIIAEAIDDLAIKQYHGNLEHWAKQGVLMLNTVLTVQRGKANSHAKQGWEDFTDQVISVLNEKKADDGGLVFLLWGNPAKKKAAGVDEDNHFLIQSSHPSPLGATKTSQPFLGSRCFSRANKALEEMGKEPINWDII
ncbi:unnamed protein product [Cylindrotheca closterium]|uniref:Uracil-DNA glycosylase n=1 Tax=Cylindrotheca closterium TaxID=2856 RepID=A0AAD2JPM7_9STRA|nr:unnamed protein product [Cylindrotheca closterium]